MLHVAGAQIAVTRDVRQNESAILAAIDWAASAGADILLTPEGSLSGYTHEFDTVVVVPVSPGRFLVKYAFAGILCV